MGGVFLGDSGRVQRCLRVHVPGRYCDEMDARMDPRYGSRHSSNRIRNGDVLCRARLVIRQISSLQEKQKSRHYRTQIRQEMSEDSPPHTSHLHLTHTLFTLFIHLDLTVLTPHSSPL